MFHDIENLKITSVNKGVSQRRATVSNRKSNTFVLRMSGKVRYTFQERSIENSYGEIIFLPAGSSYFYEALTSSDCEFIAVSFDGKLTKAVPSCYPLEGFWDSTEFISNMYDLWKFGGQSEHYRCYSIFYNLLSYLQFLENQSYMDKNKLGIISPAISYLRTHIYDCNLNVEMLYELCGVSGTYFRKLFQLKYGVSPQKYILKKRLSYAKSILDNGEFRSIAEVASTVGYSDPLYFSRAFKKKYGVSPSLYAKG